MTTADTTNAEGRTDVAFAPLDGERRVAYAEYGVPEGSPVVFLHGTPGSRLLGELLDDAACERGLRLLAPDRPGYGRSSPWPSRTLSDTGALLDAVLDDAGVERAGVVGFSGGGPHALAAAATREERVAGVDVISGAAPPGVRDAPPVPLRVAEALAARTPRLLRAVVGAQRRLAKRASPETIAAQYTTPESRTELPDDVAGLLKRDFLEALSDPHGFVTESRLLAQPWDVPLSDIEIPVQFWHGERDGNASPGATRTLADRIPDASFALFDGEDHVGALLRSRSRALERD